MNIRSTNLSAAWRTRIKSNMRPGSAFDKPKPARAKRGTGRRAQSKRAMLARMRWEAEQAKLPGVFVPMRVMNEANVRGHWSEKSTRAKQARDGTHIMLMIADDAIPPSLPATILLTRYGPKEMDDDGNVRALKAVRDGVADYFGVDDARGHGLTFEYAQVKVPHRWYGVRIERKDGDK